MCWTLFKTIGQSLKKLGPSQKTLRPTWCPKLVMDLWGPLTKKFGDPALHKPRTPTGYRAP